MWGCFYKHSPEVLVTRTLQLQARVWEHSLQMSRKLKTAWKILSVGVLKIREREKECQQNPQVAQGKQTALTVPAEEQCS